MRHRLLSQLILVLALGAVAAPLAHATGPYDGYKSSYPQLHQAGVLAGIPDPDYKSSYPQLHQVLSGAVSAPGTQATTDTSRATRNSINFISRRRARRTSTTATSRATPNSTLSARIGLQSRA